MHHDYGSGAKSNGVTTDHTGRWPANLVHDGSDEVLALFPETKSGKPGVMRLGKNNGAAYGSESRPPGTQMTGHGDSGSAARFFYCAKASKKERDAGLDSMQLTMGGDRAGGRKEGSAGLSPRAGTRSPGRNVHPTVKPIALMRWLVRMVTPPGGTVLDPFCGSGTTGIAAKLEGMEFLGIEMSEEYCELARARIEAAE